MQNAGWVQTRLKNNVSAINNFHTKQDLVITSAMAEVQETKMQRIMAENEKLIKERQLFKKEIHKMENLMEVITKPLEDNSGQSLKNLTKEEWLSTFKTL